MTEGDEIEPYTPPHLTGLWHHVGFKKGRFIYRPLMMWEREDEIKSQYDDSGWQDITDRDAALEGIEVQEIELRHVEQIDESEDDE